MKSIIWPRIPASAKQLLKELQENIIYSAGKYGIFALIKPFGIATTCGALNSKVKCTVDAEDSSQLTVNSVLHELEDALGVEKLVIVQSLPRNHSGIILLASAGKVAENLNASIRRSLATRFPYIQLHAVCVGQPQPSEYSNLFAVKRTSLSSNSNVYLCDSAISNRQRKIGLAKFCFGSYKTLDVQDDCSLVKLNIDKLTYACHRLLLSEHGSPVLGDQVFQKRVTSVLGKVITVPAEQATNSNQIIPTMAMKRLGLSLKEYHLLPLSIFVNQLILPRALNNDSDFTIQTTKLPSHFKALTDMLGFNIMHHL
ncbi:RNA pseudouridylate synthase domain-containing protein 3 [Trichinella zimbabwensis]|uniref:RNA pseudouridylate synthase domain-containing protein 3 n=2 Tax=Trichinella TaxID=6333 RepID=A0A0V1MU20_9BILA|nr:RNA pseudouridylate synthase domain-containing protein 3 [Trichinella zimbabwensis]KRZ75116.1 RNA pseudouridylate synthase domain-containing protein 3 [Trichinella papuae]